MAKFNLNLLKQKTTEILDTSADVLANTIMTTKKVGTKVSSDVLELAQDIARKTTSTAICSDVDSSIKTKITSVLETVGSTCESVRETINKPKVYMEHKILMMGGRRAGKSTILSSILTQLRQNTPGTICTIIDKTDYTQTIETSTGTQPLPTLDIKQNEIRQYINKCDLNREFLVDMGPTYGKASYTLEVSADGTSVDLEFIDVPGEWMRANVSEHAQLSKLVEESDVFVIAIDTPFLMNTEDDNGLCVNRVYNRINEITQAMTKMKINSSTDLKQIILCPIKCEKWLRNGDADQVVSKVIHTYRDLINRWVSFPEVTIQIMPIQTVGGFESTRMLPARIYFKDENDKRGESCSEDQLTGLLLTKSGRTLRPAEGSTVESDPAFTIDHIDIPLSWFKLNNEGLRPKFCEQPGFHILKFLVEKEEFVIKEKAEAERKKLDQRNPIWRWFTRVFNPTFGQYLPIWKNVIIELNSKHYIKTEGDGFCYVHSKVV